MMKDILYSSLQFKRVKTDQLFYGQWRYCIKIALDEISLLRDSLDPDHIVKSLSEREHWRNKMRLRWPQTNYVHSQRTINEQTQQNLLDFAEFLRLNPVDHKRVISVDNMWIYTSDVLFIERIKKFPCIKTCMLNEAVVTRQKGTVSLKNSSFTHRSYFRNAKLTPQEKENIHNFLQNQKNIRISPGMQEWLETHFVRTQDYYFVDHLGMEWLTMLSLVRPGIIRRTLPIIAK